MGSGKEGLGGGKTQGLMKTTCEAGGGRSFVAVKPREWENEGKVVWGRLTASDSTTR